LEILPIRKFIIGPFILFLSSYPLKIRRGCASIHIFPADNFSGASAGHHPRFGERAREADVSSATSIFHL
jgi:hypothetical protein